MKKTFGKILSSLTTGILIVAIGCQIDSLIAVKIPFKINLSKNNTLIFGNNEAHNYRISRLLTPIGRIIPMFLDL